MSKNNEFLLMLLPNVVIELQCLFGNCKSVQLFSLSRDLADSNRLVFYIGYGKGVHIRYKFTGELLPRIRVIVLFGII